MSYTVHNEFPHFAPFCCVLRAGWWRLREVSSKSGR
jgi:hypothetical protein